MKIWEIVLIIDYRPYGNKKKCFIEVTRIILQHGKWKLLATLVKKFRYIAGIQDGKYEFKKALATL